MKSDTSRKNLHDTRESWLRAATVLLRPYFESTGYPVPQATLDVRGNAWVQSSNTNSGYFLNNGSNSVADIVGLNTGNDNGELELYNLNTRQVELVANGASYLNGGNVGIGTTGPLATLDVVGPIRTRCVTVATLPTGKGGMRHCVTDATSCTFLGALTGGGSTFCPVIYNGSAWVGG